jgi:hypothetical protein
MPTMFGDRTPEEQQLHEFNLARRRRGRPALSLEQAREHARLTRIYERTLDAGERARALEELNKLDRKPEDLRPRRRLSDLLPAAQPAPTGPAPKPTTAAEVRARLAAAEPRQEPAQPPARGGTTWKPPVTPDDDLPF